MGYQKILKKKLCEQCEGEIDLQMEQCIYCGSPTESAFTGSKIASIQPLYKTTQSQTEQARYTEYATQKGSEAEEDEEDFNEEESLYSTIGLFFLLPGSVFLLFSLLLLTCSHEGKLILQWNSSYWPTYLFLGSLLTWFGWSKFLSKPSGD